MDPITIGLLAGGGLGLAKGTLLDPEKEKRQRKRDAEMARWSPWTGMGPQGIQEADPLGSTMQGAMGGAMLGQGIGAAGAPAATAAAPGGAALTTDAGTAASLTGGQSVDPALAAGPGGYQGATSYNQMMAQKYPWLGMR